MKQIIQSFKTGETILEEVPAPQVGVGQVLIQSTRSLVSLGTEKMLVEFGKANLLQKARKQPDKVKMVLGKVKADGLLPTLESVFKRLGEPLPLGYCNVGKVIQVGKNVKDFKVGDRVASNGPHAEFVCVPVNLCAHIPANVTDEEATFTVIGSIGLQGIRLLNPTLGETIVVTGLGLIGLITAQLLKANGCKVIGLDIDESKLELANKFGIITYNPTKGDSVNFVKSLTADHGADGVIITASNKSNDIISQAANMSRKRGRIILVGVIGLELNRSEFYEKELTFQVSCSYGPGRYDDNYEQKGIDYPLPFVRWTEKRNFETILSAIDQNSIDVKSLITENVKLNNFKDIYGNIGKTTSIASILHYDGETKATRTVSLAEKSFTNNQQVFAIVGAGNFTKMTMLPVFKEANIKYIVSKGGLSAKTLASKYNIPYSTSSYDEVLSDQEVNHIIITTRHNLHCEMTLAALEAGKNVFVEKPLSLNINDLNKIIEVHKQTKGVLTLGFNRRFSPHIEKLKSLVPTTAKKNMIATMNAGFIPQNVWIHDMEVGGGRIIGEACHLIDLLAYISGSHISSVCMNALGENPEDNTDNASILLKFANGDNGVVNYFSNGSKSYSKERLEVFYDEKTLIMDNFRTTRGYGTKNFRKLKTKLSKGHKEQFVKLSMLNNQSSAPLIPFKEIVNVTKASFAAIESMKENKWIDLED